MKLIPNMLSPGLCLALFSCNHSHGLVGVPADAGRDSSVAIDSSPAALIPGPTASLAFGPVALGSSSPARGFTITNTGPATTDAIAIGSDNGEFTIHGSLVGSCVSGVTTLAPGASCLVSVVFTPAASGSRSAVITFSASSSGGGSVSATGEGTTASRPVTLAVLAGHVAGRGSVDGKGPAARFHRPNGLALDSSGNLIVAEQGSNTIRRITPAGEVTTLAGSAGSRGSADGMGANARFDGPSGVAVDALDNIFVADSANHTIRKITPSGSVTTFAGSAGSRGSVDGAGVDARFSWPGGLAVDPSGHILVAGADTIRRITPEGVVTTLAGKAGSYGDVDGTGAEARFHGLAGIAVDASGWIFVSEGTDDVIRKISPDGVVTTLVTKETLPGRGDALFTASFDAPSGLAVDGAGNLFVAETDGSRINKVTPAGIQTVLAGVRSESGCADGTGAEARFRDPLGIVVDRAGNVFVSDTENDSIRKISPAGVVTTLAGTAVKGYADGPGPAARFESPVGIAVDQAGNIFAADFGNGAIRKITPTGVVTTLIGPSRSVTDPTGSQDKVLPYPFTLAPDSAGNVFVATWDSSIQKVTPTGVVSTIARNVSYAPGSIAVNAAGDLLVVDYREARIIKVTPAGAVSPFPGIAGSGFSLDFSVHDAPLGLAVDGEGNVSFSDGCAIRRIAPDGATTTLAGKECSSTPKDGTGADASFRGPTGVALDGAGNVFVADQFTIRKITPTGTVSTVIGGAAKTSLVNLNSPLPLSFGIGLAVSPLTGDLYITIDSAVLVASY